MDAKRVLLDLPDCLIMDIFSRLPVKSLCRFKCVSKFFLSFIQDPLFINGIRPQTPFLWQIQKNNDIYVCSIDSNGTTTMKHHYSFGDDYEQLVVFNGLNCYVYNHDFGLYVCNVATKERIALPRWCNDCVFCFDSSSNRYKILAWVESNDRAPLDFQILTLERGSSWRSVLNPLQMNSLFDPDVTINEEPYWLDISQDERRVISFNPANEEFRVIALPAKVNPDTYWYCIFEFEGSLSLVEQLQFQGFMFSLWILDGNLWVMMKEILMMPFETTNLYDVFPKYGFNCWSVDGLNISSRGGEIVVTVVREEGYQYIFMYSFLNNCFKTIKITGLPFYDLTMRNYMGLCYRMRNYVENHVSLQELV